MSSSHHAHFQSDPVKTPPVEKVEDESMIEGEAEGEAGESTKTSEPIPR
jgi:hypothetical protein